MANYPVTEYDINLSVLQQKDPYIVSIADTASQVAAYSFNSSTNGWEKTNIEGTLFVYTRSAIPVNGFMIINRLHLQDLIEPINKNLEFQLQDPFLLYKDSRNECNKFFEYFSAICGIWFYDRDECARIGQLMNRLCVRRASESDTSVVERFSGDSFSSIHAASSQKQNIDILQLLSKAQDEYDKVNSYGSVRFNISYTFFYFKLAFKMVALIRGVIL
ncbi:hypothetical protein HELRODRAFT_64880 [Helobdella robusta]|uniref:5'-(N(7)-methylguanosine 5'-triphospho)-[mRNA] hydrolase n=1 Tax=Helobdella robusta TaxID=6412 RepID=T1FY06_HELRO|nr:hypothetical protein HELRODRAFT_64880 [Helobdella robusta]ESO06464.1 hypothetical protein HELRODRAFT_64880 [Helobdella robusta]